MDIVSLIILFGLACMYFTRALLLEEKIYHEGPFKLKSVLIFFPDTQHTQNFALFDLLRLFFGAYKRASFETAPDLTIFEVRDSWLSELWTCPGCLSLWVSIPLTVIVFTTTPLPLLIFPIIAGALAAISLLGNTLLERMEVSDGL